MIDKKGDKIKQESKAQHDLVDLENQFILRLPEEPATYVREALQTGALKDRMTIKLDNDLRYGELRFDHWMLHAKVVDLPTIIECLKTIDNKSFYKTADICQMMICKEEPDALETEKESPNKGKKKDPNKVDKKYLWPHGVTPPCKNVRKRRFRKTLKKKNVEAPEIEKEVKRLLRVDNDAVKVDFEIINEDIEEKPLDQEIKEEGDEEFNNDTMNETEKASDSSRKEINVESDGGYEDAQSRSAAIGGVDEQDIFGEELSSSDDDDDIDRGQSTSQMHSFAEASRLSADDTQSTETSMSMDNTSRTSNQLGAKTEVHQFNKSMFNIPKPEVEDSRSKFGGSSSNLDAPSSFFDVNKTSQYEEEVSNDPPNMSPERIRTKLYDLKQDYSELRLQKMQKAQEVQSISNPTLKMRMEEALENIQTQILEKERLIKNYQAMLN